MLYRTSFPAEFGVTLPLNTAEKHLSLHPMSATSPLGYKYSTVASICVAQGPKFEPPNHKNKRNTTLSLLILLFLLWFAFCEAPWPPKWSWSLISYILHKDGRSLGTGCRAAYPLNQHNAKYGKMGGMCVVYGEVAARRTCGQEKALPSWFFFHFWLICKYCFRFVF